MSLTKAGTFTKNTVTGNQVITGLGFEPKAVLFFTGGSASANEVIDTDVHMSYSFTAGPTDSYSVAGTSIDGGTSTNTAKAIKPKLMVRIGSDGSTIEHEADLVSFDSDGFTINWTTNDANATKFTYFAIGGANVSATTITWNMPTAVNSAYAIEGVGLTPSTAFHLSAKTLTTSESGTGLDVMIGASNSRSSYNDWCLNGWVPDATASDGSTDIIGTLNGVVESILIGANGLIDIEAQILQFDVDGFTMNFTTVNDTSGYAVVSLCLQGVTSRTYQSDARVYDSLPVYAYNIVDQQTSGAVVSYNGASSGLDIHEPFRMGIGIIDSNGNKFTVGTFIKLGNGTVTSHARYSDAYLMLIEDDNAAIHSRAANSEISDGDVFYEVVRSDTTSRVFDLVFFNIDAGYPPSTPTDLNSIGTTAGAQTLPLSWSSAEQQRYLIRRKDVT